MADLWVLSWFHREPRGPRGTYRTGWTRGLQAYLHQAQALEALDQVVERAQAMAGDGAEGDRLEAERDRDLGASHVDLVAYTLAGPPSLELLAAVVSSPPRGDPAGPWDPLVQSADWWTEAKLVRHWWGGAARASRACHP